MWIVEEKREKALWRKGRDRRKDVYVVQWIDRSDIDIRWMLYSMYVCMKVYYAWIDVYYAWIDE